MNPDHITLDQVLARLKNVKPPRGGRIMACCPAHNDRTPSLAVTVRPSGRVLVKCFSNNCPPEEIWKAMGFGGRGGTFRADPRSLPKPSDRLPSIRVAEILAGYRKDTTSARLRGLAGGLGVSVDSLVRVGACYAADKFRGVDVWGFPMFDADGRPVGIRYRDARGKKFALAGGREGLFIDASLPPDGPVCMCEGPTSLAALLDLGFPAIARPSCNSGVRLVKEFLVRRGRCDVVVIGDNDEGHGGPDGRVVRPGQDGAHALKREIASLCRTSRVVVPPTWERADGSTHRVKDMRQWKQEGATHDVVAKLMGRPFMQMRRSA